MVKSQIESQRQIKIFQLKELKKTCVLISALCKSSVFYLVM